MCGTIWPRTHRLATPRLRHTSRSWPHSARKVAFGCARLRPTPTPRLCSAYSSASPWVLEPLLSETDHRTSRRRRAVARPAKANGSMLDPFPPSEFSASWEPPKHIRSMPDSWTSRTVGENVRAHPGNADNVPSLIRKRKGTGEHRGQVGHAQAHLACPWIRRPHRGRFQPQQRPRLTTAPLGLSASCPRDRGKTRAATHTG